jgi:hypothetical protein
MGAAFDRVLAALDAHGIEVHRHGGKQATVHCPGPAHWRGDVHPSLVVADDTDRALIYCHTGCEPWDLLNLIGLTWPDLYNEPLPRLQPRNRYGDLARAIGKAAGFTQAEKTPMLFLLIKCRGADALIPPKFQPKSSLQLASQLAIDRSNLRPVLAHWEWHGWLVMSCMANGCLRMDPHPGSRHRTAYLLRISEPCPGRDCPCRKKGSTAPQIKGVKSAL